MRTDVCVCTSACVRARGSIYPHSRCPPHALGGLPLGCCVLLHPEVDTQVRLQNPGVERRCSQLGPQRGLGVPWKEPWGWDSNIGASRRVGEGSWGRGGRHAEESWSLLGPRGFSQGVQGLMG